MPLTDEQIQALYQRKTQPKAQTQPAEQAKFTRQIRLNTQYPKLPSNGPVTWHDTFSPNKSLRCASRGCSAPTSYKYKGIPYCQIHLIILLSERLTNGNHGNTESNGSTGDDGTSDAVGIDGTTSTEYLTDTGTL